MKKLTPKNKPELRAPSWDECVDAIKTSAENKGELTDIQRRVLRAIFPALWNAITRRAWARGENALRKKLGKKPGDEIFMGDLVDGDDDNLTEKYPGLFSITKKDFAAVLNEWRGGGEELRARYNALLVLPANEQFAILRAIPENIAAPPDNMYKHFRAKDSLFPGDDITKTNDNDLQFLSELPPASALLILHGVAMIMREYGSAAAVQKRAREIEKETKLLMDKMNRGAHQDAVIYSAIRTPPLSPYAFIKMIYGKDSENYYKNLQTGIRALTGENNQKTIAIKTRGGKNTPRAIAGTSFRWETDGDKHRLAIPTPLLRCCAHYFIPLAAPIDELLRRLTNELRGAGMRYTPEILPLIMRALTRADNCNGGHGNAFIGDDELCKLMPKLAARGIPAARRRAMAILNAARRAGFFAKVRPTDDGGIVVIAAANRIERNAA